MDSEDEEDLSSLIAKYNDLHQRRRKLGKQLKELKDMSSDDSSSDDTFVNTIEQYKTAVASNVFAITRIDSDVKCEKHTDEAATEVGKHLLDILQISDTATKVS